MLIRIWILLLAVAFATSTIAAPDLSTDRVEIVELHDIAFDDAMIETDVTAPELEPSPIAQTTNDLVPPSPAPVMIWRPPRFAS